MMNLRMLSLAVLLGVSLLLAACGGNTGGNTGGTGGSGGGGTSGTTIDIASEGENLAFDKPTLTLTSGQQVTLNFRNTSASQQHNWILVNGGADVASSIATEGLTAGAEANFLPSDQSQVIAATPLANGGETTSVTFTAPAPGTYLYICTVPGHYPLMQGTLTVN